MLRIRKDLEELVEEGDLGQALVRSDTLVVDSRHRPDPPDHLRKSSMPERKTAKRRFAVPYDSAIWDSETLHFPLAVAHFGNRLLAYFDT